MRKHGLLALILVIALLATTSCSLIVKDEEVDRATTVIEVAGEVITKGQVQDQTNYLLDYNEYMYSTYGMSYDKTDAANIADSQAQAIDLLVESTVLNNKVKEYGFDVLTAEEEAEMAATAKEDYQLYYDTTKMFYFSDTELTGDELDAAIKAEMANMGYPDEETLLESAKLTAAEEKLYNEVVKDVVVTDEEVEGEYQSRVAVDKSTYDASPAAYGSALTNGTTVYYAPEGYRYVKHILVQFAEEDQTAIDELNAELTAKQAEVTEEENETLNAEIADLEAQIAAATETAYANLQPTIDEISAKIAAGEDFNALIDEYNTDPGMTSASAGYPLSADSSNFVTEFRDGGMALAAIGDVSEPVRSSYGIHIIKYESDIPAGEIGLETVKEAIMDELLTTAQETAYSAAISEWVEAANVKTYEERMK